MLCQNWSKVSAGILFPPRCISAQKSNKISLLCFLFKHEVVFTLIYTQPNYILYWGCRCCNLTKDMADVICIQTFISQDAHKFLLHTFTHYFITDCNRINQMVTDEFTFVTYFRWQNPKHFHIAIFIEILISKVKLAVKTGLLPITKVVTE